MIFHRTASDDRSFASRPRGEAGQTEYRIYLTRLLLALLFFVILIGAAFTGRALGWTQFADAFLHLTEISAGGMIGLFIGERSALKSLPQP